jgi:hypothetical protein
MSRDPASRVRALARLLDDAVRIPGTDVRVGLDPVLGLVPGLGDLAGAALSGYIVVASARLGAPTPVLARMVLNIAADAIIGGIPLLGDLFDAGWKANARNSALLDRHLADPMGARRGSAAVMVGVIAAVILLAIGIAALGVWVMGAIVRAAT